MPLNDSLQVLEDAANMLYWNHGEGWSSPVTVQVPTLTLPAPRVQTPSQATEARIELKRTKADELDFLALAPRGNRSMTYLLIKRAIDVVGAIVLLVALSPIMLSTLLILTVTTRGKAVFRQQRMGFCGRRFWMYKFRTMHVDAERQRHLVQNQSTGPIFKNRRDPRVTRFGRFLRSFSIDEMPQLVNVLRGEMSLVGPRPLPVAEAERCDARARRRFAVKPGLTCLWQVSGRSDIGFDGLVRMDLWYLKRQSVWTDIVLLLRTPLSVLSRKGAY